MQLHSQQLLHARSRKYGKSLRDGVHSATQTMADQATAHALDGTHRVIRCPLNLDHVQHVDLAVNDEGELEGQSDVMKYTAKKLEPPKDDPHARWAVGVYDKTTGRVDFKNADEFDLESSESVEVKISEVVNGNTFYVHRISDLKSLESLGNQMESNALLFEKEDQDFKPQRGTLCSSSCFNHVTFIRVMSLTTMSLTHITRISLENQRHSRTSTLEHQVRFALHGTVLHLRGIVRKS